MSRALLFLGCLASTAFCLPSLVNAQFTYKDSDGSIQVRKMHNPYSRQPASRSGYLPQRSPRGLHNSTIETSSVKAMVISDKIAEKAQREASTTSKTLKGVSGTREHGKAIFDAVMEGKTSEEFPINMKEFKPDEFRNIGLAKTTMEFKHSDIWGRTKNHTDGTYTETVFDHNKRNPEQMKQALADGLTIVTQRTRRPSVETEDPILLIRDIYVDEFGVPKKVDILDGKRNLKFKGFFIYDKFQRLTEEQIFEPTKGASKDGFFDPKTKESLTLVRRKVYPYHETTGDPMPPVNWDYCRCGRSQGKRANAKGCKHCMQTNGQELVALIQTPVGKDDEMLDYKLRRLKNDIEAGYLGNEQRQNRRLGQPIANTAPKPFFKNKTQPTPTPTAAASPQPAPKVEPLQKKKSAWGFFKKKQ